MPWSTGSRAPGRSFRRPVTSSTTSRTDSGISGSDEPVTARFMFQILYALEQCSSLGDRYPYANQEGNANQGPGSRTNDTEATARRVLGTRRHRGGFVL